MNICTRPDERPAHRTHIQSVDGYAEWIENWNPTAMLTLTTPTIGASGRSDHWYLNRWTLDVEKSLYGSSALRLKNQTDRCLWFFLQEASPHRRKTSRVPERLVHYHGFLVLPERPMRADHRPSSIPDIGTYLTRIRVAFQSTLRKTPEVFGAGGFRDAMLDVAAFWHNGDESQVGYTLKDRSRVRRQELPSDFRSSWNLLPDHGLMIFPTLALGESR